METRGSSQFGRLDRPIAAWSFADQRSIVNAPAGPDLRPEMIARETRIRVWDELALHDNDAVANGQTGTQPPLALAASAADEIAVVWSDSSQGASQVLFAAGDFGFGFGAGD